MACRLALGGAWAPTDPQPPAIASDLSLAALLAAYDNNATRSAFDLQVRAGPHHPIPFPKRSQCACTALCQPSLQFYERVCRRGRLIVRQWLPLAASSPVPSCIVYTSSTPRSHVHSPRRLPRRA